MFVVIFVVIFAIFSKDLVRILGDTSEKVYILGKKMVGRNLVSVA